MHLFRVADNEAIVEVLVLEVALQKSAKVSKSPHVRTVEHL